MASNSLRQPKAAHQIPPFHEALGKELSQKFLALADESSDPFRSVDGVCLDTRKYEELWNAKGACISRTQLLSMPECPERTQVKAPKTRTIRDRRSKSNTDYKLEDLNALHVIESLVGQYGRMTHMGVRDHSYQFYLNLSRTGVLSYRLVDKVAVIGGDPICLIPCYKDILQEFRRYCRSQHWQYAITGAGVDMLAIAKELGWTTVHFAKERALNVQHNPVLLGADGKRIRTQCKQLMKKGMSIDVYCPIYRRDAPVEQELKNLYETWRGERNASRSVQAYVTVFDIFALHRLMVFLCTKNEQGHITGFAALRKLRDGYHVDPLIASASAPRGTVDLLLLASMALLREAGIERLVLGVEPLDSLEGITGMSRAVEHLTRKSFQIMSAELPLCGKRGFNDRFRPDDALEQPIYMLYPNSPNMRQSLAMAHFANIKVHSALKQKCLRDLRLKVKELLQLFEHRRPNDREEPKPC